MPDWRAKGETATRTTTQCAPPKPHRIGHFKLSEEFVDWLEASAAKYDWKKTAIVEEALRLLRTRWETRPPTE